MVRIGSTQPAGESPYAASNAATKEKMRAEYNPHTKTFEPMGAGETKKIDHMEKVEESISKVRVPTDYTSPSFLQKVATKTTAKGDRLESDTKGVGAYLSGNASLYNSFISSISNAQDLL